MSTTEKDEAKKPADEKPKKPKNFSSTAGDKVRGEHRRSGLIKTLIAGALGGAAYGAHRGAEKFLPGETRRALDDTQSIFNRLQRTKALSGGKLNPDDVIEAYATHASRLAAAPVAGMQGKELVKLLRTKLPVAHPWQPHYSDAHYDAFARGPAYGVAQVIDEKADEMAKNPNTKEKLRKYLSLKWPDKFSSKVNETAAAHGLPAMDVGPSFRESIAYNGVTMPKDKQLPIAKEIVRGGRFTKDRIPLLGGFSDHYEAVKKNLSGGIMNSSFPKYIELGHKAKGVHKALSSTIPAILGAAGVGVGGYGVYKLIKSLQRTPYEKRMMRKAEEQGDADVDGAEKSASGLPRMRMGPSAMFAGELRHLPLGLHQVPVRDMPAFSRGKQSEFGRLWDLVNKGRNFDSMPAADEANWLANKNLSKIKTLLAMAKKAGIMEKKADNGWCTPEQQQDFNAAELERARQDPEYVANNEGTRRGTWPEVMNAIEVLKKEQEKSAMIKQEGDEWILYTRDGKRVLGRHKTKQQAIKQEYAIQKSQEKRASSVKNLLTQLFHAVPTIRSRTNILRVPGKIEKLQHNTNLLADAALVPEEPLAKVANLFTIEACLRRARNETHTHPTDAQRHAGNYRKGSLSWNGLVIKIENPEGSTRRGTTPAGKEWSSVLKCDYGYFAGNGKAAPKSKDGDAIDVFIGPDIESDTVAVIDQCIDGKFDEHKVLIGIKSEDEARKLYLSNYQKGWKCGPITMTDVAGLKEWLASGKTTKEFAKAAADEEPSTIGKGLGTLFSDFFPYAPSGARRAGAASLMAERIGEDPGVLLKYPMLSQVLAMAGGGALGAAFTPDSPKGLTALTATPWAAVQLLKRMRIESIDKNYAEKKRKRLREVDAEGMVDQSLGSHRLGMAQAHDAMRNRKYRDIGALAEAGDALPVATHMLGLGPAASLPITQILDHIESNRFREKKADWTDQINAPAIPMYLAAAWLARKGLQASHKKLDSDMRDPNLPSLPREEWEGLAKHISGKTPLTALVPMNNAFHARARNDDEARGLLSYYALHDPEVRKKLSIFDPTGRKLINQVKDHGLLAFGPNWTKGSVVGHEAGHGKIEHTPGILNQLQRKLYQHADVVAPISAVGGLAAGLTTKSTLGGLLAGTGVGLLGGAGVMLPEAMATYHGLKGLKSYKGGKFQQKGDTMRQLTALATYGSLNVLPAALSGAFGGYVGKKRKEKADREAREAGEEPENITRMDEGARNVEKAASLLQRFQRLQELKLQAKALGRNRADVSAVKEFGSYLKPSINQFFNNKEVQGMGIRKGMKPATILELLKRMQQPPGL